MDIPTETGAVKTTIYNLNVLNQLAMVEMKNKVLNDTAKKFSDILSEVETTGNYSITKPDSYMIDDPIERAKRWIEETEEWQADSVIKECFITASDGKSYRTKLYNLELNNVESHVFQI